MYLEVVVVVVVKIFVEVQVCEGVTWDKEREKEKTTFSREKNFEINIKQQSYVRPLNSLDIKNNVLCAKMKL